MGNSNTDWIYLTIIGLLPMLGLLFGVIWKYYVQ